MDAALKTPSLPNSPIWSKYIENVSLILSRSVSTSTFTWVDFSLITTLIQPPMRTPTIPPSQPPILNCCASTSRSIDVEIDFFTSHVIYQTNKPFGTEDKMQDFFIVHYYAILFLDNFRTNQSSLKTTCSRECQVPLLSHLIKVHQSY